MTHLVCFGLGYSATAIARRAASADLGVTGTSRTPHGAERITAGGMRGLIYDGSRPGQGVAQALASATQLLVSPAPDADGCPVLRWHRDDILAAPRLRWIGYLSTVGVYGDHGGAWVDETTELRPMSERSRRRVLAEQQWLELAARKPAARVQIFRLAGIYGPGRSIVEDLAEGSARRIIKPGQVFNRIHVADIALSVTAAMVGGVDTATRTAIYNVTDDEPAPPQDVVAYTANMMGLPVPPAVAIEDAGLSPMGISFYGECKRVSNARLKADLVPSLLYPTYRQGIAALVAAHSNARQAVV